jgi:hypothetical protein
MPEGKDEVRICDKGVYESPILTSVALNLEDVRNQVLAILLDHHVGHLL